LFIFLFFIKIIINRNYEAVKGICVLVPCGNGKERDDDNSCVDCVENTYSNISTNNKCED
jgi:hypothetical protein